MTATGERSTGHRTRAAIGSPPPPSARPVGAPIWRREWIEDRRRAAALVRAGLVPGIRQAESYA
ncbi:hypothetical protein QTQ03_12265 [Micromonospora sp. WMMA1363]|uniref:hypothetical protein n=1 Tax=Micromonospora sp. WMMA1363 TaxID=3053985 RepID=UPI00259CC7F2|nr:hypothetical protein [Micromonospora sp. WMMA1363]MDM4720314.1 hypothetical protein [Micromonospora sp. WMMA1363]